MKYGIIAVGYNRPDSLRRLIRSIVHAEYGTESVDLLISIDKSDIQDNVADAVSDVKWNYGDFRIIKQESRLGLRNHILKCGDLVDQYDAVVVLEDDLVVSPYYFDYVKETVLKYADDPNIGGISLYKHETHPGARRPFIPDHNGFDAYMMQFAQSWGQCWTKSMWNGFRSWYADNEKSDLGRDTLLPDYIVSWNNQSWLKFFMRYLAETDKYFIYPYISLSTNASDVGEHNTNSNNDYQVALLAGRKEYRLPNLYEAVRYDVFLERQGIENQIFSGLKGKKVLDLYGQRHDFSGADYLISTQSLPYKQEISFQIKYRPHEINCLLVEEGNDAFVYSLNTKSFRPTTTSVNLTRYDVRAVSWKRLLGLGYNGFLSAIRIKIDLFKRKWK